MSDSTTKQLQVLLFSAGSESVALELQDIHEIQRVTTFTPVYGVPEPIRGILNVRGTLITLFDLPLFFTGNLTPIETTRPAFCVIAQGDTEPLALISTGIEDCKTISHECVHTLPQNSSPVLHACAEQAIHHEERLFALLQLQRLFTKRPTEEQ
ncbi:chemotaxis protein CheW [Chitinivibrio alkaliphilus]|uniref:Chemotaxis signal transduction protein CheW n=1 Tax=Chitinivibrio alkaliphilus ACht1 TaxID=1313304 RepID=U7D9S3_9BACT|nr:chemotaxis protein CheW [Chitinivibrio alkaliphilus]ERP31827.1 Chemotaxis signal transduction protein CheW [Chitinivibrio alkaliphilus ACht1]